MKFYLFTISVSSLEQYFVLATVDVLLELVMTYLF